MKQKTKEDETLDLKIEIVKHVFTTLEDERKERRLANEAKEKREKILGIISDKEDEGLRNMPLEDLKKLI